MAHTDPSIPERRRWTREEYYRLSELGLFLEERVELIDGDIILRPRQTNLHSLAIALTCDALNVAFGRDVWVRLQMPLDLSDCSVPDPDIAVIAGGLRSHRGEKDNPTTALLTVEVSETTLHLDRHYHGSLYASVGIADYWILDLSGRQLEVYRDPVADTSKPFGWRYGSRTDLSATDTVSPLAAPNATIKVADLLP